MLDASTLWTRSARSDLLIRQISLLSLIVAFAPLATAQDVPTRRLDASQPCKTCELRIEKVVTLADPVTALGSSGNLSSVERDSRGRYWVADYRARTNILVFAANGKLIKRIGRQGSGPGEFRNVTTLVLGPGDTIHAFDEALKRRTEISPTTFEVVAQYPIAGPSFSMVMLANGNFAVASPYADIVGRAFDEFDRKGERIRSFGGEGKKLPEFHRGWETRRIASDGRGGFYAIPRRNYIVEHWSPAGTLLARFERGAPWFPFSEPRQRRPPMHGEPDVFAHWVNAEGLLFVASHVRQDGWQKALSEQKDEVGRAYQGIEDYDGYYDSIIEVIDPKTLKVLVSVRDKRYFEWSAANGEIYRNGEDGEDIEIYRVTFTRR